jgi:hypothetical protein
VTALDLVAFLVATGVAVIFGYFITVMLLPASLSGRWAWVLGPGIGFGFCSLLEFVFRRPMFTLEGALLFAIVGTTLWTKRRFPLPTLPNHFTAMSLAVMAVLGMAVAGMMLQVHRMPHAAWDGWAIWNTHARLIHRDGPHWQDKISYTFHADYPEFTPLVTARFWRYAGHEVPETGAFIGILLALSTVAVLTLGGSQFRSSYSILIGPVLLLSTPSYLEHAANQYADIPLAFFILSTIVLLCLHFDDEPTSKGLLILAGFLAGCAGWTKNEGLLFMLATSIAILSPVIFNPSVFRKRFFPFLAGMAVPLAVTLYFKLAIAPPNDIIGAQTFDSVVMRLFDWDRHAMILRTIVSNTVVFGRWAISPVIFLVAWIALRGVDSRRMRGLGFRTAAATIGIVLVGYYFVYLNTPIPIQIHLDTSLDRLMLHVWPSALLLVCLSVD